MRVEEGELHERNFIDCVYLEESQHFPYDLKDPHLLLPASCQLDVESTSPNILLLWALRSFREGVE